MRPARVLFVVAAALVAAVVLMWPAGNEAEPVEIGAVLRDVPISPVPAVPEPELATVTEPHAAEIEDPPVAPVPVDAGTVRGRLFLPGPPARRAIVHLFEVRHEDGDEIFQQEALVHTERDFLFEGVGSGQKLVAVSAHLVPWTYVFYRRGFDMQAGGSVDLGELFPLTGGTSSGEIVLAGDDGAVLEPSVVYGREPLAAILHVSEGEPLANDREPFAAAVLDVQVDQPFTLVGLRPGGYVLSVTAGYQGNDFWPPPRAEFLVDEPAKQDVRAPFSSVRIPFRVTPAFPLTVRVHRPPDVPAFRAEVLLRRVDGWYGKVDLRPDWAGAPMVAAAFAPAGAYDLLVHADGVAMEELVPWFGLQRVDVAGPSEFDIVLRRGQVARGRADRGAGYSLAGWTDRRGRPIQLYQARPRDGAIAVGGVPPGMGLIPIGQSPSLTIELQ